MVRHIIFDLGNVLVEIHPDEVMTDFARRCHQPVEKIKQFYLSALHLDFMTGLIPPTKFYHYLMEEFQCNLGFDEFLSIWKRVVGGPKPGIPELVEQLAQRYVLSVCSNTDPWHWETALEKCAFFHHFKYVFLSYELQHRKPDPYIFEYMLKTLQAKAGECLFIDDTRENIEAAARMGFQVLHAWDAATIEQFLRQQKLL
ncbi:MAG: HAD family phosphatase [Calditrichaeota bacterium]|nr:HAD family phosphatase [Calditrichota bacterium]